MRGLIEFITREDKRLTRDTIQVCLTIHPTLRCKECTSEVVVADPGPDPAWWCCTDPICRFNHIEWEHA